MKHINRDLASFLLRLDLGSSVAESDNLLQNARIETSAFADILNDRVDLVPGTKGSGKSALFRIFIDFLPETLLRERKVVIAHGVQAPGDPVFHAFGDQFEKLSEEEFVSFWCIYLVSLAHEQFIKGERYEGYLRSASAEIIAFRNACVNARIPEISAKKSLRAILEWSLHVLYTWRPKLKYTPPGDVGEIELDLFGRTGKPKAESPTQDSTATLPKYVNEIKEALESVLTKSTLSLWLMVDRLDEIFPRRSEMEKKALRGLLRAMRYFVSASIRVKVFLRDDMLEQVVDSPNGFTALTHLAARQADTLRWTPEQIMAMLMKRIFADRSLATYLGVQQERIDASATYRTECFYRVFPPTVYRGRRQSPTLRWVYSRCLDGRGVVTPRDVLDLVIRAKQRQQDICAADPEGTSDWLIGSAAIQYGYEELSKKKLQTYLQAEFPHLWLRIEKFISGKTEYNEPAIRALLGKEWRLAVDSLMAIGFLSRRTKKGSDIYLIPFLYRHSLGLTQGKA